MVLQEEFKKNGYSDILVESFASECEIDLEDIFDLDQKPEELLSIFISEERDDLFFLLDGDTMRIDLLSDSWDNRIRVFAIINGRAKEIQKLKYNIVQLIVCSEEPSDKSSEGNLLVSRKIIIKGDMTDKKRIVIDDEEAVELPFHMIPTDAFAPDERKVKALKQLLPKDEDLLAIMEKRQAKVYKKERNGILDKSFEVQEYQKIKEWLEV